MRAIQYFPEIKAFSQKQCRRKPKPIARGIVAKELGKIVYYVLTKGEPYDGTFKGQPLSRTKQPEWPRKRSPDAYLVLLSGAAPLDGDLLRHADGVYLGLLTLSYLRL